jgi:hypothetical protein
LVMPQILIFTMFILYFTARSLCSLECAKFLITVFFPEKGEKYCITSPRPKKASGHRIRKAKYLFF